LLVVQGNSPQNKTKPKQYMKLTLSYLPSSFSALAFRLPVHGYMKLGIINDYFWAQRIIITATASLNIIPVSVASSQLLQLNYVLDKRNFNDGQTEISCTQ
jgi:hypothetical protein